MLDQEFSSENQNTSPWPHAIRYGVIWALVGIVMQLAMFSTGMLESLLSSEVPATTSALVSLSGILIAAFSIYKAIEDYREARGGNLSYGKAIGVGAMTGLIYGLIFAVFSYIFYNFIFTGYTAFMDEIMFSQLEESGLDEDEMEAAMSMSSMFSSPIFLSIASIPAGALYGTVISLIAGLIMKTD